MPDIQWEQSLKEAEIYAEQGLIDEAINSYKLLLEEIDGQDPLLKAQIEERLAELEEAKEQEEFSQQFDLEVETSFEEAFQEAQALKEGGFYEEALSILENLIKEGYQDPALYKCLAETLIALKKFEKALEFLQKALSLPGLTIDELASLHYLRGLIFEKQKNISKALEAYNQALHYNSAYADLPERIAKLQKIQERFGRLQFLFMKGLITEEIYEKAQKIAQEKKQSIEYVLIENFGVPKEEIGRALSQYYGYPFIVFDELHVGAKPSCLEGIKEQFFRQNVCVPIGEEGERVILAIDDPTDTLRLDMIRRVLKAEEFEINIAIREDIYQFIDYFYGKTDFDLPEELSGLEIVSEDQEEDVSEEELADSVVVQLANHILEEAYRRGASDIHIESFPGKKGAQVRLRIDGECHLFKKVPFTYKRALVSRYKIMANLDIAEKRLPQDGKIKFKMRNGRSFEVRVATLPTIENNEDVVMRILAAVEALPLDEIGLSEDNLERFKKLIEMPYGLILVVGPTGSGKTTTLHAALGHINRPNKKIWTAEDPVEIVQEGLRQVQVKPKIGLTFARVLRAFLRADPDIIMIGETRDEETAKTVIEASLTGHLVFTTLHTNSAPETVTRLLGMGMDPYNFSDALLGILAQRLAKRLCKNCKKAYKPSEEEIEELIQEYGEHPVKPLTKEAFEGVTLYQPVGCSLCNNTGYKGRLAIHEFLVANDEIRELIVKNAPVHQIRDAAMRNGMLTLKQDGLWKVLAGETDLKQIRAVSIR